MTQLAEGDPLESLSPVLIEPVVTASPLALDSHGLLRALEAESVEAHSGRQFLSRAAEIIAHAVGAPRCAFWRLRGDSLVVVDAEPFGFTVAERRALHAIFVSRSAHDSAARVLWRSQNVAGSTLDTVVEDRYLGVLRSIGIEHHVTVPRHGSLRVGTLSGILGDVASYLGVERDDLAGIFALRNPRTG